ncbi:MAG: hypothetical protein ACYSUP_12820, partial [Planctomycetota bacterium]|jgi:hypothetical protein
MAGPKIESLEIAYSSHFFLDNRRLRVALALLFDKVYLPSFSKGMVRGSPESDRMWGTGNPLRLELYEAAKFERKSDGLLGVEGVIARRVVELEGGVPEVLAKSSEYLREGEMPYLPQWVLWFRDEAPAEFVRLCDKAREKCERSFRAAGAEGFKVPQDRLIIYIASLWEKTLVPRFFDESAISNDPVSVEDTALLLHQGVLQYFLADVGHLQDEEILELRRRTHSDRLQYACHLVSVVGELEEARSVCSVSELRKLASDRVRTEIVPSFVEYARSLEVLAEIRRVRKLDRLVQAMRVEGSIFEPRFWLGAAAAMLGTEIDVAEDKLREATNERRFLAYVTELQKWKPGRRGTGG